jgi:hypothetical protein
MSDAIHPDALAHNPVIEDRSLSEVCVWLTPPVLVPLGVGPLILAFALWKHL